MMFLSDQDLKNYQELIKNFKENPQNFNLEGIQIILKGNFLDSSINKKLWDAHYAIKSSTNSETGKILPKVLRMCAFLPVNVPILFGMVCLPANRFNIALFNFTNQSYNAGMNYSNGSGTDDSTKFLLMSYTLAVVSSIGTGILMKRLFSSKKNLSVLGEGMIRILPSSIAGFLNAFFMRSDYITKGINVKDGQGNELGLSKKAGTKAVIESSLSRFFIPIPGLLSIFAIRYLSKFRLRKSMDVLVQMILCTLHLGCALPASIAIFKQYSEIPINTLEKDLKLNAEKYKSKVAIYNKGL